MKKENYLLEATRYIHLKPVQAGLADRPEEFRWSSYRDYIGSRKKENWLVTGGILERFGSVWRTWMQGY